VALSGVTSASALPDGMNGLWAVLGVIVADILINYVHRKEPEQRGRYQLCASLVSRHLPKASSCPPSGSMPHSKYSGISLLIDLAFENARGCFFHLIARIRKMP
jgi:hypothetical protein